MSHDSRVFAAGFALLGLLVFACGDDDSSAAGSGGSAGAAGSAGQGGSKAGAGGTSSKGGSAGTRNTAGTGGTGGDSAGTGGDSAGTGGSSDGGGGVGTTGGEGGGAGAESGPNIVFVSSNSWAPQALGGLAGADEKCQGLADAAGLPGTFVAWLSDSTADAGDRLGSARGWVRVDGKPFADRVEDIAAGLHYYTPSVNENGVRVDAPIAPVITGTGADGLAAAPFGDFCQNYSGPNATYGVVRGDLNYFDDRWTLLGEFVGDLQACSAPARLYCFQTDHADPVDASFPPSRKAFVSLAAIRPDMGRAAFDAQCVSEAESDGLTGSFLAFVSTTTESAASRFDLGGLTYARVDGVPIVEQASDLAAGTVLDLPINLHASGVQISGGNQIVYSGAPTPSDLATAGTSCNNWTISVFDNFVRTGNPGVSSAAWWADRTDWRCNTWVKVYCFEE